MDEVGQESEVAIYFRADFWCLAVDNVFVLWFHERFNFNESYFTIYPFFALKIADTIILYAREVLKIFNRHLNHKREFTIITRKTLHDHFWYPVWKLDTLFSIMYSWYYVKHKFWTWTLHINLLLWITCSKIWYFFVILLFVSNFTYIHTS